MYRPAPRPRTRATGNPWPTAPTHPWSASQAIPKIGLIDLSDWENDHDPISTAPNRTLPILSHQPTIGRSDSTSDHETRSQKDPLTWTNIPVSGSWKEWTLGELTTTQNPR